MTALDRRLVCRFPNQGDVALGPRVFIGSSREGLAVAYAVQESLEADALCSVWTQGVFDLSESTLANLLAATTKVDFAIFVLTPDDVARIRDQEQRVARDNVVFELGLFIGTLGHERVYFLIPKADSEFHLPTDLAGITPGTYAFVEDEKDLLASVGPFCNKVRRQLGAVSAARNPVSEKQLMIPAIAQGKAPSSDIAPNNATPGKRESGVMHDDYGNTSIVLEAHAYFENRLADAFPGDRGLKEYRDADDAIARLERLLRNPIRFDRAVGHEVYSDPIWWFRGYASMPVEAFHRVDSTNCLLDRYELAIDRVVAGRNRRAKRSFVYVEVCAVPPTGLRSIGEDTIRDAAAEIGYYQEEYALFEGMPVTRECYDDAAAVIDGKLIDISGAELRVRFLTPYNFVIASKASPFNKPENCQESDRILNEILWGKTDVEELSHFAEHAPLPHMA